MSKFRAKQIVPTRNFKSTPTKKILITLLLLLFYRFGNTIPLTGIDQDALKRSFLDPMSRNEIMQVINMYSGGGGTTIISSFSLGIIPFINASILIDLLTTIVPALEKLQSEEGEMGRQKLMFYKKILTFFFAIGQTLFLISYLKPYFYSTNIYDFGVFTSELVTGAMLIVWLTNIIDTKGIGNGTSLIIFMNIIITLLRKNIFEGQTFNISFCLEIILFLFITLLICISQIIRIDIKVVSARQLAFLENLEKRTLKEKEEIKSLVKDNGLAIRLNQAGIFPIIIASNLIPFISYITENFLGQQKTSLLNSILYYICIIGFNYFYTIIFWDPEKIAEQLRKASVSLVDVTPGKDTVAYLGSVVRGSSLLGGIFLCIILVLYDSIRQLLNGVLFNQINISSLIILVGVAFQIQKKIRSLFKTR